MKNVYVHIDIQVIEFYCKVEKDPLYLTFGRWDIMEEKKTRYTEAQKKSAEKYLKEKVEDIKIRVPKGKKQIIKEYAEAQGKSLNQFIIDLIEKEMVR